LNNRPAASTKFWRWLAISAMCFVSTIAACGANADAMKPQFIEAACAIATVPPAQIRRVRCGTVAVPRRYDQLNSGTYLLSVAVIRSARQPARTDPILLVPGGPGQAGIASIIPSFTAPDSPLSQERDIILFDPRATGTSQPRVCQGYSEAPFYLAPDLKTLDMVNLARARMRECLAIARQAGIEPEEFGTSLAVEDLERIRSALGVSSWNVLTASYGTVVGAELAARYPQYIRSLLLDSVALSRENSPFPMDTRFERALDALLAECAGDPDCAGRYPQLNLEWSRALTKLENQPLTIRMPATSGTSEDYVVFNRGDLEALVFFLMYSHASDVPAIIKAVNESETSILASVLAVVRQGGADVALLPLIAVTCRDDPPTAGIVGGLRSRTAGVSAGYHALSPEGLCESWTSPGAAPVIPRNTTVPTLIIQGELDPITAPVHGRIAAMLMGQNATFVELPFTGHAGGSANPCSRQMVAAFLAAPTSRVDTSCVTRSIPLHFR